MKIKSITMSPKKGGNGKVTSYTVNIGSLEARNCGLLDVDVIKIIDTENKQIIIKPKE